MKFAALSGLSTVQCRAAFFLICAVGWLAPVSALAAGFADAASLGTAREYHTATLLPNGKILVTGGKINGNVPSSSAELYDPVAGTWTPTASLTDARFSHTATLLPDGKVLIAGGFGVSSILNSAELYDPAAGTWTTTGPLATARDAHTATLLPNGKVLVAGGTI